MGLFSRKPADVGALAAARDLEGLADALNGKDDAIRAQAQAALTQLADPAMVAPVVKVGNKLLSRDGAEEACLATVASLGEAAVEPLLAVKRDKGEPIEKYVAALDPELALSTVRTMVASDHLLTRIDGWDAVSRLGTPAAAAFITEEIHHGTWRDEAVAAADFEYNTGSEDMVRAVVEMTVEPPGELRDKAWKVMGRMQTRMGRRPSWAADADRWLLGIVADAESDDQRFVALDWLRAGSPDKAEDVVADPALNAAVLAYVDHPEQRFRVVAAATLGWRREAQALPYLLREWDACLAAGGDPWTNPFVQLVAGAFGALEDPAAWERVRGLVSAIPTKRYNEPGAKIVRAAQDALLEPRNPYLASKTPLPVVEPAPAP